MVLFTFSRIPGYYNNVITYGKLIFIQSDTFPDQPGYPMPDNTISNFFTDSYSKSINRQPVIQYIHYQIFISIGFTPVIYIQKIFILSNRFKHNNPSAAKAGLNNRRKGHINATYADNLCLPFALLLDNTFLPLAVLILFLNPCTLFLTLFFGWYVIFILKHLLIIKYAKSRVSHIILVKYILVKSILFKNSENL